MTNGIIIIIYSIVIIGRNIATLRQVIKCGREPELAASVLNCHINLYRFYRVKDNPLALIIY